MHNFYSYPHYKTVRDFAKKVTSKDDFLGAFLESDFEICINFGVFIPTFCLLRNKFGFTFKFTPHITISWSPILEEKLKSIFFSLWWRWLSWTSPTTRTGTSMSSAWCEETQVMLPHITFLNFELKTSNRTLQGVGGRGILPVFYSRRFNSVPDSWHFGTDPDPRIHTSD